MAEVSDMTAEGEAEYKNDRWALTEDAIGVRQKQPIYCPICATLDAPERVEMVMRRSRVHQVADVRTLHIDGVPTRPYAVDIVFKCPVCDYYIVFGVPIPIAHARSMIALRGGNPDLVTEANAVAHPQDDWQGDPRVKEKLMRHGYW